jgi:RHS repeat-associated protein
VTYTVNSSSRLVTAVVDEMGRSQAATYTTNGDVATSTKGSGTGASTTTATYGANGVDSLTALQAPAGATNSAAYANTAAATKYLPSSSTDSSGNATTYTYNGAGNQLTSSDALAATATLTYNSNGTVATALAPGNGVNKTVYGYTTNSQLSFVAPVTGTSLGSRVFTYDDFGRVKTATDGKGVTITYTYDNRDRVLTTSFSDGTPTVTNTYTDTGLPKTRVDGNGTTTYGYDHLGRLITRMNTFAGGTITYGYDKSSNLTSVSDGRGTTTYAFDDSGVVTKLTYPSGAGTKDVAFATDGQGRRTDTWLDTNATNTAWQAHMKQEYDASGRVSRMTAHTLVNGAPVKIRDISYCYNATSVAPVCGTTTANDRGKLQWEFNNTTNRLTTYTYDTAGRLTGAAQSGVADATSWAYTYDSRGNRLTANATGATTSSQTLTFNAGNQVTTAGYTFDGAGNMTADPDGTYAYNGAEQMTTVTNGTGTFSYKYAGTSQAEVIQQQTATTTYKLVYGRTNPVGLPVIEQANVGGVNAYVENDPVTGQPLLLRTSTGTVSLYVYDGTGNPIALLRDIGNTAHTYVYDPYGLPTLYTNSGGSGTIQNPFLFKGGIQDRATGWVHFGNRWYDPATGRWTQQDTLDAPLSPKNANRYAYAGCDPINNIDPTGKSACSLTATTVGLVQSAVWGIAVGAVAGNVPGAVTGFVVGAFWGAVSEFGCE